jgi:hypothetical protein
MFACSRGVASRHEDLPIGLADAHSAEGANIRAKSRTPAMDQRVLMGESFEYTQQQIKSAIKS